MSFRSTAGLGRAAALAARSSGHAFGRPLILLLLALGVLALVAPPAAAAGLQGLALAGALYGRGCTSSLQGKGWEYHLYPLALFAARWPRRRARGRRGRRRPALRSRRRSPAARARGLGRARRSCSAPRAWRRSTRRWIADKARRVAALDARPGPAGCRPATPCRCWTRPTAASTRCCGSARRSPRASSTTFTSSTTSTTRASRRSAPSSFEGLEPGRPAAVVVLSRTAGPSAAMSRLDAFPALRRALDESYDGGDRAARDYRIYAKRSDS